MQKNSIFANLQLLQSTHKAAAAHVLSSVFANQVSCPIQRKSGIIEHKITTSCPLTSHKNCNFLSDYQRKYHQICSQFTI